jgi:hypothetical protein
MTEDNSDANSSDLARRRAEVSTDMSIFVGRGRTRAPADESTRGRRLLGDLISSLGKIQKDTEKARETEKEVRRRDIEDRVRQKTKSVGEKQQNVEPDSSLNGTMISRQEHRSWGMTRLKQNDSRFLRTKQEPSLLYLPRILSQQEQEIIDEQIEEAESSDYEVDR